MTSGARGDDSRVMADPNGVAVDSEYTPQLSDYVAALKRRTRLMINVALPIALGAAILAVALPEIYQSTAVIDIEETKIPGYTESLGRDLSYADQYVAGLSDEVLNHEGVLEIVRKFDPYPEAQGDESAAVDKVRDDVDVQMITVQVLDPYSGRQRKIITAFSVGFESRKPETAQQVAAWLGDAYLAADRHRRERRASSSVAFLTGEADRVRGEIAVLEEKLAEFKQRNAGRLPELTNMNLTVMDRIQRDLADVQLRMRALQQDRIFLAQQLEQAQQINPDSGLLQQLQAEYNRKSTQYDENHPDVVSLRRRIETLRQSGSVSTSNTLEAELEGRRAILAQTRERYSEDHPDVRSLRREIESLERRIDSGEVMSSGSVQTHAVVQLKTQVNAIDTQLASLQVRGSELRRNLAELQDRIESTPQAEREYQTLTRDLALARGQYDELIKKQMNDEVRQAAIEGGTADEFRLVKPAFTPDSPAKPDRVAIVVVGILLGLLAAVSIAVAVDLLDPTVRGAGDLRRAAMPPLGIFGTIQNSVARRRSSRRTAAVVTAYLVGAPLAFLIAYFLTR
jgi:polysaccharide biosynthesis transport protein